MPQKRKARYATLVGCGHRTVLTPGEYRAWASSLPGDRVTAHCVLCKRDRDIKPGSVR